MEKGWNGELDGFISFLDKEYANPFITVIFLAYLIAFTEFLGGICIALGFFTRIAALSVTIFMAFAVLYHFDHGFFWSKEGYEYPLMWGVITFAIVLNGSGNLSIDNEGHIVPIDFGIMGRLDKLNKRYLAEILFGFIQRDYKKVAEVHLLAGLVPKSVNIDEFAQALRSIGEPIFGQSVKDISGGKLLKQLFDITEKFNMQTQPQLLLLQKTMVVTEGVSRKLNSNTNIWKTSRPVLENWLKETKDPINSLTDTLKESAEVIKRLPEFPKMMDKANQALSYLASGNIPENSNSYSALKEKELEIKSFRNQSIIGLLLLVFFGIIVF